MTPPGPLPADTSLSREALYRVFGPNAFEPGLFYAHAPALRFELSLSGHRVELFTQALDRAREIVEFVFRDSASLVVVLIWFGPGPPLRHLSVFRSLRELGISIARPRACWTEMLADETEPEQRTLLALRVERPALVRLLWGALAGDLGVRPRLYARVYLADPESGVLVHPYDDRGMDVIGPDRERLAELYHRFHGYLLAYDLERMNAFFAAPEAASTPGETPPG